MMIRNKTLIAITAGFMAMGGLGLGLGYYRCRGFR